MANVLFDGFKARLLGVDARTETLPDFVGTGVSTLRVTLVDSGVHSMAPQTDTNYAILETSNPTAIVAAGDLAGTTCSVATGTATVSASNKTLTAVTGATVEQIVVDAHQGTAAASLLIVFFDTATGLTLTPNGGDVTITWNASGIFTW